MNYRKQDPIRPMLLGLSMILAAPAAAHVHWTRVNDVDPLIAALYHFDTSDTAVNDVLPVAAPLASDLGLVVEATTGTGTFAVADVSDSIFGPNAIRLESTQDLRSAGTIADTDGDLTIEFWFKWDPTVTAQTVTVGLQSTAKLVIARDTATPANDRFGIEFTHGDYVSAPGFVDWPTVGLEEASLGEWRHYAVTIHSTGMTFDAVSGHDKYNPGSTATIWLNGHATGSHPHSVSIEGMQAHDASRVRIRNTGGIVYIDEFAIWKHDWSGNGTVANPFANGRGEGLPSSVETWDAFE